MICRLHFYVVDCFVLMFLLLLSYVFMHLTEELWNFCLIIRGSRYVMVYFSILYLRRRANIVTEEMLSLPKSRFMAIGFLEALGIATGMAAAGNQIIKLYIIWYIFMSFCVLMWLCMIVVTVCNSISGMSLAFLTLQSEYNRNDCFLWYDGWDVKSCKN